MGLVIFPYIYHTNQLNVGKYTIHGSYGYYVDGSEIVEVGSLSHCLQGFKNIPGGCLGFLPSTVLQSCGDFLESTSFGGAGVEGV